MPGKTFSVVEQSPYASITRGKRFTKMTLFPSFPSSTKPDRTPSVTRTSRPSRRPPPRRGPSRPHDVLIQRLVLALRSSSLSSRCYRCAKPKNCCSSSVPGVQRNNRPGVWAQLQVSPFRWSTRLWWQVVERGAQGVVGTRLPGAEHLRDQGLWAYPWASPGIHQQGHRRQNRIAQLVSTEVAENPEPPNSASTSTLRGWSSTPPAFRKAWSADLVQTHGQ